MPAPLAADFGFGYTKARTRQEEVIMPSVSGQVAREITATMPLSLDIPYHLIHPVNYYVGQLAVIKDVAATNTSSNWFLTDSFHALYLTTLAAVTRTFKIEYILVTGLPITHFHLAKQMHERLVGSFSVRLNGGSQHQTIDVQDARILQQGIGAYLIDHIDENGVLQSSMTDLMQGRGGILDIGTNISGIIGYQGIVHVDDQTTSIRGGMWNAVSQVRSWLERDYPGWGQHTSQHELLQHMLAGETSFYDEVISIVDLREAAYDKVADNILAKAAGKWGDAEMFRTIRVCGGGAIPLFSRIKRKFKQAVLMENPQLANLEGYFRFALYLSRRGGK